jgi:hypothetical protein
VSYGRRNDYEIEAMSRYVEWLKCAVRDFPEDRAMRAFGRKCYLITLQRFTAELARLNRHDERDLSTITDRQRECAECDQSGYRQCRDESKGGRCKYSNPSYQIDTIAKNFGEEALSYIQKYAARMAGRYNEGGKDDEGHYSMAAMGDAAWDRSQAI